MADINDTLARLRERRAIIAILDRDAISEVVRDASRALRLALLASQLRREMAREAAP